MHDGFRISLNSDKAVVNFLNFVSQASSKKYSFIMVMMHIITGSNLYINEWA